MIHRRPIPGFQTALVILALRSAATLAGQGTPDDALAFRQRAEAEINHDWGGALNDFNHAIELDPDDFLSFYGRGRVFAEIGSIPGTMADYNRAIALNPRHGPSYIGRGLAKANVGDQQGAQEDYARAVALGEKSIPPPTTPANSPNLAGRRSAEEMELDRVIAAEPRNGDALFDRGLLVLKTFHYGAARADFLRVVTVNPKDAEAWYHLGLMLAREGDFAGALKYFDRCYALNPGYKLLYYERGFVRNRLGDLQGASADLDRALALNPDSTQALMERVRVRTKLQDPGGALADYYRLVALHQTDASLLESRGDARNAAGDFTGAIADYDRALDEVREFWKGTSAHEAPLFPDGYFARQDEVSVELELKKIGVKLLGQGNAAGAIADIDRMLSKGMNSMLALEYRGIACRQQDALLVANAHFTALIQGNPKSGQAYRHRALVRNAQGDFAGAMNDYRHALMLWKLPRGRLTVDDILKRNQLQFETYGIDQTFFSAIQLHLPRHPLSADEERRVSIHIALIMARTGRGDPMAGLRKLADAWPPGPARDIARYLTDALTAREFFDAQAKSAGASGRSDACYYAGMKHLLSSEPSPAAELFFRQSLESGRAVSPESQLARAELARLTAVQ